MDMHKHGRWIPAEGLTKCRGIGGKLSGEKVKMKSFWDSIYVNN